MGRVDLPYVHVFRDRHGRTRTYFRHKGRRWPLPDPSDPAFAAAYRRLAEQVAGTSAVGEAGEASLGWLIRAWQASPEFRRLAPRTRRDYAAHLSAIGLEHGERAWRLLERRHVIARIRDPLAATPRMADFRVAVLSSLYTWAVRREIAPRNPCLGVPKLWRPGDSDGYRAWTRAELATFAAGADDTEYLLLALAFYSGQRPGDLARLTWFQVDLAAGTITLRQEKTRRAGRRWLVLSIHPALAATLAATPRRTGTVLAREDGRPFTACQLSQRFAAARARLGLAGITLHGLRTTHATLLAESGIGAHGIRATTGHASLEMVEHYTRAAEQAGLARTAIAALPALPPPNSARTAGGNPAENWQTPSPRATESTTVSET